MIARVGPMLSGDVSQGLHRESEQSNNLIDSTPGSNVFCVYTEGRLTHITPVRWSPIPTVVDQPADEF